MMHSLKWEAAAAVIPTALALGIALVARESRMRSALLAAILFPALLPATIAAAVWILVYSPTSGLLDALLRTIGLGGLVRGWLGDPQLALPALFVAWMWSAIGIGTLLLWAGLRSIGREYVEVAMLEGAGPLRRFQHVLLPGIRHLLPIVFVINAALAAGVFDLVYQTTGGGPGYATMLLPIDMYGRAFGGQTGQGAAVASVHVMLGLLLALAALLLVRPRHDAMAEGEAADYVSKSHAGATAAFGCVVAIVTLPLGWLLVVALGGVQLQPGLTAATLDPRTWVWGNFGSAWNAGMAGAFETSLLLALSVVLLTVIVSAPAAFALSRLVRRRIWRLAILALLLAGLFQPTPVLIIPLFSLLNHLGLFNTPWGVLLPEVARAIPFAVLVLWGFLSALPAHVLDAAEVDGATPLQQLLQVAFPLARPVLYVVVIWSFVGSWAEYLVPTIVSQDGSLQTVPTLLATFVGRSDTEYGLLAAGSILAILPALIIFIALRGSAAAGLERIGRRVRG
jgi:ABC-type glycerol-3-phosphate transport system permease component